MSDQSESSLRSKILKGSAWVVIGSVASQSLRLISNLIMTRLLVPEMFGIMAIANVVMIGLDLVSDLGLDQNVIRSRKGNNPKFLNTVWTVQIIRGLIIWLMAILVAVGLYVFSPYWSDAGVYAEPILPMVIAVISVSAIINGFDSTKIATAGRAISLGVLTRIEILSQLAGLACMMAWAVVDRSIWAMVFGSIVTSTCFMSLSHIVLPGERNRLFWNTEMFKDIFHFGKWVFLSSFFAFFLINGDRILLGGFVDAKLLGVYSIAFLIMHALQMAMFEFNGAVAFPALSIRFREEEEKFIRIYYKFRLIQDSAVSLLVGFLMMTGGIIIEFLYDDRYIGAGPMLQVLSLILLAQRYALADQCYLTIGKPKYQSFLNAVRTISLFCFLPAGYYLFGFEGALWGMVVGAFASVPFSLYLKAKIGLMDVKKELVTLPLIGVGAAIGWITVKLYGMVFG